MNGISTAVLTDVGHWGCPGRCDSRAGAIGTEPGLDVVDPLAAGHEALSRGEWEQALACFEAASETDHSAQAIEALAMAAWWLGNAHLAMESREHAYRFYRQRGDAAAAARMAIWLGWDSLAFRGEPAVARGWLQRAHRLLEGLDPVPEHGWLALREGEFAFLVENDIAATRRFAQRARSIGTALAVPDIEFCALGLEGLALASQGEIADGIRLLAHAHLLGADETERSIGACRKRAAAGQRLFGGWAARPATRRAAATGSYMFGMGNYLSVSPQSWGVRAARVHSPAECSDQ